jgi:hypothetical protein
MALTSQNALYRYIQLTVVLYYDRKILDTPVWYGTWYGLLDTLIIILEMMQCMRSVHVWL